MYHGLQSECAEQECRGRYRGEICVGEENRGCKSGQYVQKLSVESMRVGCMGKGYYNGQIVNAHALGTGSQEMNLHKQNNITYLS